MDYIVSIGTADAFIVKNPSTKDLINLLNIIPIRKTYDIQKFKIVHDEVTIQKMIPIVKEDGDTSNA